LEVSFKIETKIRVDMSDWRIYLNYTSLRIADLEIKRDLINLTENNFQKVLQRILWEHCLKFNQKWSGVHVGTFRPESAMIGGILQNQTVITGIEDEWIMGGFSLYEDIAEMNG
jgi:hypothetical protein